ncbi:MAG: sn-glycerol-3-phosphate ABC transporter ATP-binding protein UgpC [Geminicoccaceae bacterium]
MASLEIRNVKKRFGPVDILKGIDIAIDDGEFLVLVGPSGCGKSTLLNMIAGLDAISDGEIAIDGARVNERHPKDRDIAMVFQSYALYPNMTVGQNISFGLEMRGVEKAERDKAIAEVAKLLQIDHLLGRKPAQLSGGQRQRVAMGRALVRQPKIFLFDEPLSNLDAKLRVEMRTEIKKLHQRLKATIVYVTHDQIEAMTLATRIAVMRAGVLLQLGTPKEVYENPADIFVAGFMGSPSMNLIPARIVEENGRLCASVGRASGDHVTLPLASQNGAARSYLGKDIILGLRPEHIAEPTPGEVQGPNVHRMDCTVEVIEPTGPDTLAVLLLGGIEATARLRADAPVRPGETATLVVDMGKACLFDPQSELRIA